MVTLLPTPRPWENLVASGLKVAELVEVQALRGGIPGIVKGDRDWGGSHSNHLHGLGVGRGAGQAEVRDQAASVWMSKPCFSDWDLGKPEEASSSLSFDGLSPRKEESSKETAP